MLSTRLTAALAAIIALTPAKEASAWGAKGHAVVARIAEDKLSLRARKQVNILLAADGSKDMAAVASWADIRAVRDLPNRPMHTVRMSMDAAPYDIRKDCAKHCAIKGINHAEAVLLNRSSSLEDQIVALKDLIHFTGDIHQPLHTVKNIGRQPVVYRGREIPLHGVWDQLIIREQSMSSRNMARMILRDRTLTPDIGGTPEQWAVEGRDIAMTEIYSEVRPAGKNSPPVTLPDDYAARHWPTVEMRLKQAGARLALVLNRIYDE